MSPVKGPSLELPPPLVLLLGAEVAAGADVAGAAELAAGAGVVVDEGAA